MMAEHIDGGKETISKFATVKRFTQNIHERAGGGRACPRDVRGLP